MGKFVNLCFTPLKKIINFFPTITLLTNLNKVSSQISSIIPQSKQPHIFSHILSNLHKSIFSHPHKSLPQSKQTLKEYF